MNMNTKAILTMGVLLLTATLLSSCFFTTGNLDKVFPLKIGSATISNIRIEPATIPGGATQQVTVSFSYHHEDGDLGLKAKVTIRVSGIATEHHLELNKTNETVRLPVTVSTPNTETTIPLEVTVAIGDQVSSPQTATIQVASDDDKDGIGNREDACPKTPGIAANKGCPVPPAGQPDCIWFVDNWTPPIQQKRSYKVGREIFAMVNDPDENISSDTIDTVFVWVEVPHTGDLEVFRLPELDVNSGLFVNVGPLLTSFPIGATRLDGNLSVFDGDTLLLFYGDVNNFSQQCLTTAVAGG
jgi:hypothetical protein